MSQILKVSIAAFLFLCGFLDVALTQNTTPTVPQNCSAVNNMNVTSQLSGNWYEVARSPAAPAAVSCVQIGFNVTSDNSTLNVNVTYSNTPNSYHMTQVDKYSVSLKNPNNTYGFNITYAQSGISQSKLTTFKILDTDYNNYAFVCGYTNATDNSTSFGMVLTRNRIVTGTALQGYEMLASKNYSNFMNGSMPNVTQSTKCYINGATTQVPFMAVIVTVFLALVKLLN